MKIQKTLFTGIMKDKIILKNSKNNLVLFLKIFNHAVTEGSRTYVGKSVSIESLLHCGSKKTTDIKIGILFTNKSITRIRQGNSLY